MNARQPVRLGSILALLVGVMVLSACAAEPSGGPSPVPSSALTAPGSEDGDVERPVQEAQLEPGTRYEFTGVLPQVTIEMTGPDPALYNYVNVGLIALSPDADFATDSLGIVSVESMRIPQDPFISLADIAGQADLERVSESPPEDLLAYAADLSFLEVVAPAYAVTVAGVSGRALDVRVRELPAQAENCSKGTTLTACAVLIVPVGAAPLMQSGQNLRFIELDGPGGRFFVYQNKDVPQGQAVLDTIDFIEIPES